ncbi:hypothetical protein BDV12DRAFT_123318 [Aspergillus spectabilis]
MGQVLPTPILPITQSPGSGRPTRLKLACHAILSCISRWLSLLITSRTRTLPTRKNAYVITIDDSTCGVLYMSAVLVSFCTFAAGPTDPDDLLVCNIGNQAAQSWMSVVQGVRLIRETFEPSILFSGLMAPLGPSGDEPSPSLQPRYLEYGFPRVDWEELLGRLHGLIAFSNSPDAAVCMEGYLGVVAIYEATYGKSDEPTTCPTRNKFVFIWLYAMDNQFVRCLQQRNP